MIFNIISLVEVLGRDIESREVKINRTDAKNDKYGLTVASIQKEKQFYFAEK